MPRPVSGTRNDKKTNSMTKKRKIQVINFTAFCRKANLKQIRTALKFYNEKFEAEKVPEYFRNWKLSYDDSKYKRGKILVNKHSNGKWESAIVINDSSEYMFCEQENCWIRFPRTMSEFISDVLREEDFELLFSESGMRKLKNK